MFITLDCIYYTNDDISVIQIPPKHTPIAYGCCTSRTNRYLTISSISLLLLPFISVIMIIVSDFKDDIPSFFADVFLIISYIISLITIGFIICTSHKMRAFNRELSISSPSKEDLLAVETNETSISQANLIIYTFISLLGLGDSIFNLTSVSDQVLYIINHEYRSGQHLAFIIFTMIENGLKCFYHLCLLLFLIYHEFYLNILRCVAVKSFVFCLSISCLSQWILIIVQELHHDRLLDLFNATSEQQHSSLESFSQIQHFLYPLGIEYRIILFLEFFCIYLYKNERKCLNKNVWMKVMMQIKVILNSTINKSYNLLESLFNKIYYWIAKHNHNVSTTNIHTVLEQFWLLVLVIASIKLVSISIVMVFFQDKNMPINRGLVGSIREISAFVLDVVVSIYSVFMCFILYKRRFHQQTYYNNPNIEINVEKQVDFIFLVYSCICLILFKILNIIGFSVSLKNSNTDFPQYLKVLEILFSILPIFQVIVQVYVIWILEHKILIEKEYAQILTLLNFAIWTFETFSVVNKGAYDIQQSFYTQSVWDIFSIIFVPLSIFYRFHSCIMLLKIRAQKYKIEHYH